MYMRCIGCLAGPQVIDRVRYPVLHALVFGEGIVNDATAIVLLSATEVCMWRGRGREGVSARGVHCQMKASCLCMLAPQGRTSEQK